MRHLILLIIFMIIPFSLVNADGPADTFDLIYERNHPDSLEIKLSGDQRKKDYPPSELGFLARGLIKSYQNCLSSQDKPSCVFTPSCSHFGAGCFHQYNPLKAALLTSDRLQRCHGGAYAFYLFDPNKNRLVDPVEFYKEF